MSAKSNKIVKLDESQNANQTVDKSRRSFAKVGVVAPVIMTLASRPALGAVCSVSGYISATPANASGARHNVDSCGGLSPGAYATPVSGAGEWPTGYYPGGLNSGGSTGSGNGGGNGNQSGGGNHPEGLGKRNNPLGTTMAVGFNHSLGYLADQSMYDVIWMKGNGDPDQLGAHLVAALLNAASGLYLSPNGLTVANVQEMYQQLSSLKGTFTAAPGVEWDAAQVVAFIKQTFHSITPY